MSHVQNLQEIFFYFVFGEHDGNRLLRKEVTNADVKKALVQEFTDITILLTTPPTARRHIDTLLNISQRARAGELLGSHEALQRYNEYLLKYVHNDLENLRMTYMTENRQYR
jgi:hypothetical protein